jgi:starch synthase (maltosyl-transferring)
MTVTTRAQPGAPSTTMSATVPAARPARPARIYYLHAPLAGPRADWPAHFARIAAMDFSHVLLSPPFLPGRAGDCFVTADHDRLHPSLGTAPADVWLAEIAGLAASAGLALWIDLVADRVAADGVLAIARPEWVAGTASAAPPDPRLPPERGHSAALRFDRDPEGLTAWWRARLAAWCGLGIAGFRCENAHHLPAPVWRNLIAAGHAEASAGAAAPRFLAWALGATEAETSPLAGCGFDFAASSSFAWNLRAGWLDDDTRRMGAIGPLIAMPERPFGPRFAAAEAAPDAARRALTLAAGFGCGWLMPMGFEFGATAPFDPANADSTAFRRLMDDPPADLSAAVHGANTLHREVATLPAARLISPPGQRVAALLRRPADAGSTGAVLLLNTADDSPAAIGAGRILAATDGEHALEDDAELLPGEDITLLPAAARLLALIPAAPIRAAVPMPDLPASAAGRIDITAVAPEVGHGRFAVKRQVGDMLRVTADIVADGHEMVGVALLWRPHDTAAWQELAMERRGNDRYAAEFPLARLGRHEYVIEAWIDRFGAFRDELAKKHAAGLNLALELQEGCDLVQQRAAGHPALAELVHQLQPATPEGQRALLLDDATALLMQAADPRPFRTRSAVFPVDAERRAAGFASWYELFPRSQTTDPTRHGTFRDVVARLPAIRDMGFDVLYFPPIHPIGKTHRKGRNNSLTAGPDDPGSPYAIGSAEGGHDAIHPELGTIEDFRALRRAAADHGLELALDFAIQCSPDHPWLREHPEWFAWRPDGTIRYAENPPKKYEDIVNVDFYAEGANPSLWIALRDVVLFWVREGVRIFRVDNPHTKPFPFWEWLIADIRGGYPDVIFLAEAFTRPKVMYRLARIGFSQSYTYFTWRHTAAEFREYLTELTEQAPRDFFRPNFFVNTPDINPPFLQRSGRAGFLIRAALATTLAGVWGLYSGFELCEAEPIPGREEYLNSEKYEIRVRDWNQPGNIIAEITRLNAIRRANPALQTHLGVNFLHCDNDDVLCFVKAAPAGDNMVIVAIGMNPHNARTARLPITSQMRDFAGSGPLRVEDLMTGRSEDWHGDAIETTLDPANRIFAVWRVQPAFERTP